MNRTVVNWIRERNAFKEQDKRIRNLVMSNYSGLSGTTENMIVQVLNRVNEERIKYKSNANTKTSINYDFKERKNTSSRRSPTLENLIQNVEQVSVTALARALLELDDRAEDVYLKAVDFEKKLNEEDEECYRTIANLKAELNERNARRFDEEMVKRLKRDYEIELSGQENKHAEELEDANEKLQKCLLALKVVKQECDEDKTLLLKEVNQYKQKYIECAKQFSKCKQKLQEYKLKTDDCERNLEKDITICNNIRRQLEIDLEKYKLLYNNLCIEDDTEKRDLIQQNKLLSYQISQLQSDLDIRNNELEEIEESINNIKIEPYEDPQIEHETYPAIENTKVEYVEESIVETEPKENYQEALELVLKKFNVEIKEDLEFRVRHLFKNILKEIYFVIIKMPTLYTDKEYFIDTTKKYFINTKVQDYDEFLINLKDYGDELTSMKIGDENALKMIDAVLTNSVPVNKILIENLYQILKRIKEEAATKSPVTKRKFNEEVLVEEEAKRKKSVTEINEDTIVDLNNSDYSESEI
uniref:PlxyGVORF38 protein n=2 Tax=Plutella xylostella granulovirus TaxID=98383 RepID=A0A1B2CSD6_9BBAC|nr:PlxyGVORF38 protein [Plutella xylostella granulovirus]